MRRISLSSFVAALLLAFGAPLHAQSQSALPQGEGRDLVAVACTQCHALAPILAGREGPAGWRRHVHNMVLRGAQLNGSEAETVIRYLSANFGPGTLAAANIALPSGTGKELVETRCAVCHDLERVAVIKRPKRDWPGIVANMVTRGATATPDETQAIAAYLVAHFGSD
jgi:cytochrome c5